MHTHTQAHTKRHHTQVRPCTKMHALTHTNTYTHAHTHTHTHTHTPTHVCPHTHTRMHKQTHTHAHQYTHTHTHTHTHATTMCAISKQPNFNITFPLFEEQFQVTQVSFVTYPVHKKSNPLNTETCLLVLQPGIRVLDEVLPGPSSEIMTLSALDPSEL